MQSGRCPGAIRIPLTVIVRPAHAGSPAAHGDIVVVRRLRVRDGCARMRNETEERRAMDTPESYGLCISARRRMRRIGHAVVPAVACTVIDAPCAPGQAAVGWRRSPDRCAPAALPNARCAAPRRAPRAPPAGKKKSPPSARRRNGGGRDMSVDAGARLRSRRRRPAALPRRRHRRDGCAQRALRRRRRCR